MGAIKTYLEANTELDLKIKENAKGVENINQTIRNGIKSDLTEALKTDLQDILGESANVGRTHDGVAVELEIGGTMVAFVVNPVIKPLDYDLDHEITDYQDMVAEKEAEALAKANKKKK